jgi:hypothetical protein
MKLKETKSYIVKELEKRKDGGGEPKLRVDVYSRKKK